MNKEDLSAALGKNPMILAYFSTPDCNVCKVLRPKVEALLQEQYPECAFIYIDCVEYKETAAQFSVFAVPTLILFIEGKESIRKSRNVSLYDLSSEIERPYNLLF
jgi:thioredoxin-like negative regulator of GroEL